MCLNYEDYVNTCKTANLHLLYILQFTHFAFASCAVLTENREDRVRGCQVKSFKC